MTHLISGKSAVITGAGGHFGPLAPRSQSCRAPMR